MIGRGLIGMALLAALWGCGSEPTHAPIAEGGGGEGAGGEGGKATPPVGCAAFAAEIEAIVALTQAADDAPGATAMAVHTPECGLVTRVAGDHIEEDSFLRVGGITKSYVAAALLALAEEGAVDLDLTLDSWVPGVPNGELITLRQLMNHTAGVFDYTHDLAFMLGALANPAAAHAPEELVQIAALHGPMFPPGSGWSYSNTGYVLLGMVLEAVTGKSAHQALHELVFAPAGLERTFLDGAEAPAEPLAPAFDKTGQDVTDALHPSVTFTAAAAVADVGDVARWTATLHGGRFLPPARLEEMHETVATGSTGHAYGLGMSELSPPILEVRALGHGGGIAGYVSLAFYLPEHDSAIAVVVTSDARNPGHAFLEGIDAIVAR